MSPELPYQKSIFTVSAVAGPARRAPRPTAPIKPSNFALMHSSHRDSLLGSRRFACAEFYMPFKTSPIEFPDQVFATGAPLVRHDDIGEPTNAIWRDHFAGVTVTMRQS